MQVSIPTGTRTLFIRRANWNFEPALRHALHVHENLIIQLLPCIFRQLKCFRIGSDDSIFDYEMKCEKIQFIWFSGHFNFVNNSIYSTYKTYDLNDSYYNLRGLKGLNINRNCEKKSLYSSVFKLSWNFGNWWARKTFSRRVPWSL